MLFTNCFLYQMNLCLMLFKFLLKLYAQLLFSFIQSFKIKAWGSSFLRFQAAIPSLHLHNVNCIKTLVICSKQHSSLISTDLHQTFSWRQRQNKCSWLCCIQEEETLNLLMWAESSTHTKKDIRCQVWDVRCEVFFFFSCQNSHITCHLSPITCH